MVSITIVKLTPHYTVAISQNCELIMTPFITANHDMAVAHALASNPGAELISVHSFEVDSLPDWATHAVAF